MELRDYQHEAIQALYSYFADHDGNPLLVLPTGSGKSVIQAEFQRQVMAAWPDQRILLLTHVRELIEQNAEKLWTLWPEAPMGLYAASLNHRDGFMPIVFASIQSVHRRAFELGRFDLVIIDEAHLVPINSNTIYRRFLADMREINPAVKIIGMSATPFRLGHGYLHKGDNAIFTDIAYEVPIKQLIDAGYLVPLITKGALQKIDLSGVGTRAGEFVTKDVDAAVHEGDLTRHAVDEIISFGADRRSWLIFCSSVAHAEEVADLLAANGIQAATLHGGTPKAERERLIAEFRSLRIQALTNCDVLTTGFDSPPVDLLVFLRPTKSASLYIQTAGRGMRLSPDTGKTDCLVLDFAGNVERHGPVDAVEIRQKKGKDSSSGENPAGKECPMCNAVVSWFTIECDCGYQWRVGPNHGATATSDAILTSQIKPEWLDVKQALYRKHRKAGSPESLRVDYICGMKPISEWVCIEHQGYARTKARQWFARRKLPMPESVADAFGRRHTFPTPTRIKVRANGRYHEVIDYEFGSAERGDPRPVDSGSESQQAQLPNV